MSLSQFIAVFIEDMYCCTFVKQAHKLVQRKKIVTVLSILVKTFTTDPIVVGLGVIDLKGSKFNSQHITDLPNKVY